MSCNWICGASPARPPPPATVKASITQLHASIVSITGTVVNAGSSEYNKNAFDANIAASCTSSSSQSVRGIGVLIHPTLVLTTHSTIPSPASIKDADISFCLDLASSSYVKRKFVPQIFFHTDADLDLTIVSCEIVAPEVKTLALDTTKLSQRAMHAGHMTFIMGCHIKQPEDVVILEGSIVRVQKSGGLPTHVIFQTGDDLWMPGSAGFDEFGTFSFLVTSPSKNQEKSVEGSKCPKQQASSIQVVKEWMEPLWRMNRDKVFQGPELAIAETPTALVDSSGFKRPSLQGNPVQKQTSVVPSGVVPDTATPGSTPIRQATLQGVKNVEKLPMHGETAPASPPSKLPETLQLTTKSIGVETVPEDLESDVEKKPARNAKTTMQTRARNQSPDRAMARERRAKREEFMALKKKNGLKTLRNKGTKTAEPVTDSVSVQTELFVTEADVKPMIIVSRSGSPEAAATPAQDVLDIFASEGEGGRKGHRERWSLPADGQGLDLLRGEDELPPTPPTVIRRSRASMSSPGARNVGCSNSSKESESVPSWMDKYYARGRSLSEAPSQASSAGTTPPRPRRQVVSDHLDTESDGYETAGSQSGSSTRSLQRAQSNYFRPTISYVQKRNPSQRDTILARQASQTALPRWS